MRLKEIELKGFKSFLNKTKIEFNKEITSVVGPNGSGKSNISDAVRWVLGEQSIKTLRGSKMEDVIFAGTDKKKPLGLAEVTISFDNKSGLIPVEYEEVAITRRVFRSGESQYFLNKNACRLKDIRELLMDTGIGKEGYSIIGQGRIGEILSNNPAERRGIFEEAAGIIKHKSKKEQAQKKLAKTDDNLIRINDLLSELRQQESSLKRQADKAKKYEENYHRLKSMEVSLLVSNIEDMSQQVTKVLAKEKLLQEEESTISSQAFKLEEDTRRLKQTRGQRDIEFEKIQTDTTIRLRQLADLESEIRILIENTKFKEQEIHRLQEEGSSLDQEQINLKGKLSTIGQEITSKEKLLSQVKEALNEENTKAMELIENISRLEKEQEDRKNSTIEIYNKLSDKKSELNSVNSISLNMDQRAGQLNKYINEEALALDKELRLGQDLEEELRLKSSEINKLFQARDLGMKEKNKLEAGLQVLEADLGQLDLKLEGKLSSHRLYKKMEDSYDGYYKGVKTILKLARADASLSQGILGVVAELITVDDTHELAISTALGASAQFLVTKDQLSAKKIIDKLYQVRGGRVTCLPLDKIKGRSLEINDRDRQDFKVIGIGSELVKYDPQYKNIVDNLLGKTIVVENMDNALGLSNKYKNTLRIITLKGNLVNPGGSMTGGSQNQSGTSLLSRKNQIDKLEGEIQEAKRIREKLELDREDLVLSLAKKDRDYTSSLELIKNLEIEQMKLSSSQGLLLERVERIQLGLRNSQAELKGLEDSKENLGQKSLVFENEIKDLSDQLERTQLQITDQAAILFDLKKLRDQESKKLTENRLHISREEGQLSNLRHQENDLRARLEKMDQELEEKLHRGQGHKGELEASKEVIKNKEALLASQTQDLEKKQEEEKLIRKILEEENEEISKLETSLKEIQESRDQVNKNLGELGLDKLRKEMELKAKEEELFEKYELSIEEGLKLRDRELDLEKSLPEIKRIRKLISSLGNVNLNSIEEYRLLQERLGFISGQKDDLLSAKQDLEELIKKIEATMRERFSKEFNKINENFKEIFKILFNGGQASLAIENEGDILNSGIEIKAMPPGKKLQNLSSLSGGERSLIAVSILFAILKIKPAPFCILDEIDAALDESNIERYTSYLKEISNDTQFIIITHRKRTMEVADVLYGVTMEEEGVSKLISVELKDYEEEAS